MKQVLVQEGRASVQEVPVPKPADGTALIRTAFSCISVGTEMAGVRMSGQPLWKRAVREPEKVLKSLDMVAQHGLRNTLNFISSKIDVIQPTGYSAAGTIVEAGTGFSELPIGARVACAGAQCAFHAEYVVVPRNLVVPIPDNVELKHASSVALGAIALQGVRRAQPTLGETFVVVGLGIIGQLTAQLLRVSGCRTIGMDLDLRRLQLATENGLDHAVDPVDGAGTEQVARLTDGIGADGIIITASSPSDEVVATAFRMCRKKGRVVLVGDVGLNLNRADFYEKEIDFLISASYGPGRYDRLYEERNLDYPLAYVRWTENRNMGEYLRLLSSGKVDIARLSSSEYAISDAPQAYLELERGGSAPVLSFLSYPSDRDAPVVRTVPNTSARARTEGAVQVAVIGAGEFAQSTVLPNLRALSGRMHLRAIVDAQGARAVAMAKRFGADLASTEYRDVLDDPTVDAVYIATRHSRHAEMTLQALKAGKHVLVEKPIALTSAEADEIEAFVASAGVSSPVLLTGFNRRFSPHARLLAEVLGKSGPLVMSYRMNAGRIPVTHWVHGPEGGGRNRGEACHIYDLFTFLTSSAVGTVHATAIEPRRVEGAHDNFVATISFQDGSIGSLIYTALGSSDYPKETMDVFSGGKVASLIDYRAVTFHGRKAKDLTTRITQKGHLEELEAFAMAVRTGTWPIPLWQQLQATRIAIDVERQISPGSAT